AIDARDGLAKVKDNALGLVQRVDEPADLLPHHTLERDALRCDHVNGDATRAQGRRDLEADEAPAHNYHVLGVLRFLDENTTVRERPQIMHVRTVSARDRQMHSTV